MIGRLRSDYRAAVRQNRSSALRGAVLRLFTLKDNESSAACRMGLEWDWNGTGMRLGLGPGSDGLTERQAARRSPLGNRVPGSWFLLPALALCSLFALPRPPSLSAALYSPERSADHARDCRMPARASFVPQGRRVHGWGQSSRAGEGGGGERGLQSLLDVGLIPHSRGQFVQEGSWPVSSADGAQWGVGGAGRPTGGPHWTATPIGL